MVVKGAQIPFHRRSRYEDILELVNDNEEALKPFSNRDAVFFEASNKGSYFDGRDHLDKLKAEQNRISEREVRDRMMRQYASDEGLTHRALFTHHNNTPEIFNMETDDARTEVYGNDETFFDTEEGQTDYTNAQIIEMIRRAEEARQTNQAEIAQAHQQQMEIDQEGGDGVLHSLGRGLVRAVSNTATGVASGQDLTTSAIAGFAEPVLSGIGDMVMRRIQPQPRPLLDFLGGAQNQEVLTPSSQTPSRFNMSPTIILQPHQPNVGETQQPLPPSAQNLALPAVEEEIPNVASDPRFAAVGTSASRLRPKAKAKPKTEPKPKAQPSPTPNVQEGGSSSSSGNAPPPQQPQPEQQPAPKRRVVRKTTLKESAREDTESTRQEQNMQPLIIPSKIGIQKLREVFEGANNKKSNKQCHLQKI